MTRAQLLGTPETVQHTVDVLLFAETRGPAALDRELDRLSPDQQRAALRHLLGKHNGHPNPRSVHDALERLDRHELADERAQIRRGGNR